MASSNGGEGPVEMSLYGADWQARDGGDLGEFQLFEKAEKKYASLPLGELRYALPYECHLFAGDESRFQGTVAVRYVRGDVGHIDCGLRHSFPKAKTVGAGMVAHQVQSDS